MALPPELLLQRRLRVMDAVARVTEVIATAPTWRDSAPELLRILGESTDVSRSYIFEFYDGPQGELYGTQTYEWAAPGVAPQMGQPELHDVDMIGAGFTRWIDELAADRPIIGDVEDFPEEERPILEMQDIVSMLVYPLFDGPRLAGFIGFDFCNERKSWTAEESDTLRIAGRALSGAIFKDNRELATRRRLDLLSETVIDVDRDGTIRYVNPAWQSLLAMPHAEAVGQPLADLVHPEDRAMVLDLLAEAGEHETTRVELRLQRGDASWIWVTLAMAPNPQGGIVCAAHDVSAWRERADAIAATKAKSEFLARMSHEIRTPLNAITGLAYLAARSGLPDPAAGYVQKIESASHAMLGIINDILDFTKIEANAFELAHRAFALQDVLTEVDAIIGTLAREKGLTWTMDLAPGLPARFVGDPVSVEQVLTNLAGNAIKFTDAGSVRLRVGLEGATDTQCTLRFEVEDTGIGMSEETAQRVFTPFQQADVSRSRRYGGTGLGLSISKYLCEAMGGRLAVRSALGEGSTFTALMTLAREELPAGAPVVATDDAAVRPSEPATPRVSGRVLVVEDNKFNQLVIRELLKRFGATVVLAADGVEALTAMDVQGPFDFVLMDIQMPRMDGYEATRRIRAMPEGRTLPIFAITANVTPEDRARCFAAGMDDFIPKPVEPERLAEVLTYWQGR
jgi:two-component system, sensor histidine kinase and response regulator